MQEVDLKAFSDGEPAKAHAAERAHILAGIYEPATFRDKDRKLVAGTEKFEQFKDKLPASLLDPAKSARNPWDRLSSKDRVRAAHEIQEHGLSLLKDIRARLTTYKAPKVEDPKITVPLDKHGKLIPGARIKIDPSEQEARIEFKDSKDRVIGSFSPRQGTLAAYEYEGNSKHPSFAAVLQLKSKDVVNEPAFACWMKDPQKRSDGFVHPAHVGVIFGEDQKLKTSSYRSLRGEESLSTQPFFLTRTGDVSPDWHRPTTYFENKEARRALESAQAKLPSKLDPKHPETWFSKLNETEGKYLRAYLGSRLEHFGEPTIPAEQALLKKFPTKALLEAGVEALNKKLPKTSSTEAEKMTLEDFKKSLPALDTKDKSLGLTARERRDLTDAFFKYTQAVVNAEDIKRHSKKGDIYEARDAQGRVTSTYDPARHEFTVYRYQGKETTCSFTATVNTETGDRVSDLRLNKKNNEEEWLRRDSKRQLKLVKKFTT